MLIFIRVVVFVVWGFGLVSTAGAGIITVAGSGATGFGEGGFSGDGGAATDARLNEPHGIALDGSGNLYISDRFNHRIRKVDASGTITTVAGSGATGSGEGGFSGDGGAATDARLNLPRGIALDGSGNLYIADTKNHRIRKVDASGTITTVAGSDDTGVFGGFSGDGGPATDAQLAFPHGIALDDSGNLYIADTNNLRIRKVDASGVITTVAGNGKSAFSGDGSPATGVSLNFPTAVVADASGNLFIADTGNHRIRKVPALAIELSANPSRITADGTDAATIEARLELQGVLKSDDNQSRVTFSISSGTGSLSDTEVTVTGGIGPTTLTSGSLGTVIVQASTPGAVDATVEVTVIAGVITTVAGSGDPGPFGAFSGDGGQATAARLHNPVDVFADGSGNLYIADRNNNVIRKVDASGIITTVAGADDFGGFSGDGGPATDAELRFPSGVYVDDEGNLYIGDALNNRIRKVDASGVITTVAGNGEEGFSGDGGAATDARLNFPTDLSLDGSGNLFIVDPGNHRVRKVDASGVITTVAGSGGDRGLWRFLRGRWPGNGGEAGQSLRCFCRRVWQSLHRRLGQRSDPEGGPLGYHHHGGGTGGVVSAD